MAAKMGANVYIRALKAGPTSGKSLAKTSICIAPTGYSPLHQEKTPSLTVDPDHFNCFGCGAHGDAINWLVHTRRMTFQKRRRPPNPPHEPYRRGRGRHMWRVSSAGLLNWDLADGDHEPIGAGHYTCGSAPRALLRRPRLISLDLTPSEVYRLIKSLEGEAEEAIAEGQDDYADCLLCRCSELREAAR